MGLIGLATAPRNPPRCREQRAASLPSSSTNWTLSAPHRNSYGNDAVEVRDASVLPRAADRLPSMCWFWRSHSLSAPAPAPNVKCRVQLSSGDAARSITRGVWLLAEWNGTA